MKEGRHNGDSTVNSISEINSWQNSSPGIDVGSTVSLIGRWSLGNTGCSHVLIWVMVTSVQSTERTLQVRALSCVQVLSSFEKKIGQVFIEHLVYSLRGSSDLGFSRTFYAWIGAGAQSPTSSMTQGIPF